jgi:hypothetical protein
VSYAQRLRQSPPRELEREYALFFVGLPLTGISPTRFHEALSRAAIAVTIVGDRRTERARRRHMLGHQYGLRYSAADPFLGEPRKRREQRHQGKCRTVTAGWRSPGFFRVPIKCR